jgi:DNA-binding HxlR family transcriptional regulator
MRSYGQYCALAKALDVVGERWSLLIVRELLLRPCRYGELQDGLPGIATNLLAERLRALEGSGVITRDEQGRYVLTDWGRMLSAPVAELVRWGALLMNEQGDSDAFRTRWLEIPLTLMFAGVDPGRPHLEAEIRTADESLTLESANGEVAIRSGPARSPAVVISGPADAIVGLLAGRLDEDTATAQGVHILGDFRQVAQLRQRDWLTGPYLSSSGAGVTSHPESG